MGGLRSYRRSSFFNIQISARRHTVLAEEARPDLQALWRLGLLPVLDPRTADALAASPLREDRLAATRQRRALLPDAEERDVPDTWIGARWHYDEERETAPAPDDDVHPMMPPKTLVRPQLPGESRRTSTVSRPGVAEASSSSPTR